MGEVLATLERKGLVSLRADEGSQIEVAVGAARRELEDSERRLVDCLLGIQRDPAHPHVSRTPGVCAGEPVVAGTSVAVDAIADYFFAGKGIWEVQRDYPHLTQDEILDALHYALDQRKGVHPRVA